MLYTIQIDKNSIKENPDAGSTVVYYPLGPEEITTKFDKQTGITTTTRKQPIQVLYLSSPIAKYDYKYLSQNIKCDFCNKEFDWSKLQEDYDDEYGFIENICPYCNMSECCEISFEKLGILK